jgi:hypothetical protein
VDGKKLEALTKAAQAVPAPTGSIPKVEPETPVDLSKADEKLSSLLGKPK